MYLTPSDDLQYTSNHIKYDIYELSYIIEHRVRGLDISESFTLGKVTICNLGYDLYDVKYINTNGAYLEMSEGYVAVFR